MTSQASASSEQPMIVIVDYGMGNFGSIRNMLKKIGTECVLSSDPAVIEEAGKIILAGIGHFDNAIESIKERNLLEVLHRKVLKDKVPCIGICLGMQLMTKGSEEGRNPGLGWIRAMTRRFDPSRFTSPLRIPQMGWNTTDIVRPSRLFEGDDLTEHRYYFVHSYAVECEDEADVLCRTTYGYPFVSAFEHENLIGVQFHPEKSHKFGMNLLQRFVENY